MSESAGTEGEAGVTGDTGWTVPADAVAAVSAATVVVVAAAAAVVVAAVVAAAAVVVIVVVAAAAVSTGSAGSFASFGCKYVSLSGTSAVRLVVLPPVDAAPPIPSKPDKAFSACEGSARKFVAEKKLSAAGNTVAVALFSVIDVDVALSLKFFLVLASGKTPRNLKKARA